ncbi:glucosyltransferase domain-containing protein [[Pasteurella] aerogenes]
MKFKCKNFIFYELSPMKALLLSYLLAGLFIFPILNANVYYEDDLFRIFTGQYVWEMLGRVFTFWLMHIVTFSSDLMLNVTPLPLIISFFIIGHLIFYVARNILENLNVLNVLMAFCFVCNPYLLSNLSYSYDCLHMVLGFYLAVISYVMVKGHRIYSVLILLATFLLYQPMGNVFLSLVFFHSIKSICKGDNCKKIFYQFIFLTFIYVISILLYFLCVKLFYLFTSYPFQRSEMVSFSEILDGVFLVRIVGLFNYLLVLFENVESKVILISLLLMSIISLYNLKGFLNKLIVLLSIFGSFLSIFGPMFFLKEGLMTARVLTPLGTMLLILLYLNKELLYSNTLKYIYVFLLLSLSWYNITLSFGYGNHLSLQRKYDETLLLTLQNDILSLHNHGERIDNRWISLDGCTQTPKSVQLLEKLRPFYKQLNVKACTWRSKFILFEQTLGNFKFDRRWNPDYSEIKKKICNENIRPSINRELYSIYSHKDFIFISLGKIVKCKQ